MANETPREVICRYLQDAIAAEKNFESQLKGFSTEGEDDFAKQIFAEHAEETRMQHERLTARLHSLNEQPSTGKSLLAHLFGMAPKTAQVGQDESERVTQNLIIGCAAESSEVAMYEALAVIATEAGDADTERLARDIQKQERAAWEKVRGAIPSAARRACLKLAGKRSGAELVNDYLEDTIAAERNFESLLSSFSKTGNQERVRDLFFTLAARAKTQHERLTARLSALGGSASAAKSALAHILGFTPGIAQAGHADEEKNTQNLIMTCGAAGGEMAMYEALIVVASNSADSETGRLAQELQQEERTDFDMTWGMLPASAIDAFRAVTGTRRGVA